MHPDAKLDIGFQRTLRIPDDGKTYPLPPGFGCFPLRHVDDHARRVCRRWLDARRRDVADVPVGGDVARILRRGTTMSRGDEYPVRNQGRGRQDQRGHRQEWSNGLHARPQDYMVAPRQPWLDGYCVEKGMIRQFVAMPLGAGYTAEEQITGQAEHGGLQIVVYPMKREVFERRFPEEPEDRMATDYGGSRLMAAASSEVARHEWASPPAAA